MQPCRFDDLQYQALLENSGSNPMLLNYYYDSFQKKYGRPPSLREIPDSHSETILKKKLDLDDNNYTTTEKILEITGTSTLDEAVIALNDEFNDLQVEIKPGKYISEVSITKKASQWRNQKNELDNSIFKELPIMVDIDNSIYIKDANFLKAVNNREEVVNTMLSSKEDPNAFKAQDSQLILTASGVTYRSGVDADNCAELKKLNQYGTFALYATVQEDSVYDLTDIIGYSADCLSKLPEGAIVTIHPDLYNLIDTSSLVTIGENIYQKKVNNPKPVTDKIEQTAYTRAVTHPIRNQFREISKVIDVLRELYGVQIIPVSSYSIQHSILKDMPEANTATAFVKDGNIYVNTDLAQEDAPIHEMMHILLGSIRATKPTLYQTLVEQATNFSSFDSIAKNYPNRTQEDVMEEVFVEEVAKYMTGRASSVDALSDILKYELEFNLNNFIDSIIMGHFSAENENPVDIYKMTWSELADHLASNRFNYDFKDAATEAGEQRTMANLKSYLMRENTLKEIC